MDVRDDWPFIAAALAVGGVLTLSGFAVWDRFTAPVRGEVIDTEHTGAYTSVVNNCNRNVCTPIVTNHPESWSLRLRDGDETGWRDVSEHAYESCGIGDHYDRCTRD